MGLSTNHHCGDHKHGQRRKYQKQQSYRRHAALFMKLDADALSKQLAVIRRITEK